MRTWALKRQLVGVAFFSLLGLVVIGVLIFYFYPRHSCMDQVKNGDETGVDCGGSCPSQCLDVPKDPVVIWARYFQLRDGSYDIGAMVENPNLRLFAQNIAYTFRVYDAKGQLLDTRSGKSFMYPNEKTFFYEPNLSYRTIAPAQVEFRLQNISWQNFERKDPLLIDVQSKNYEGDPMPLVHALLRNRSLFLEKMIEVHVMLMREDGNVYAASRTTLEEVASGETRDIVFTWPGASFETPNNILLLYRRIPE